MITLSNRKQEKGMTNGVITILMVYYSVSIVCMKLLWNLSQGSPLHNHLQMKLMSRNSFNMEYKLPCTKY